MEDIIIKSNSGSCCCPQGLSAYEVWLAQGNTGSEADFFASLKGPQGDSFTVEKVFQSITEMEADTSVPEGKFVIISSDVEQEDNGKLYVKAPSGYVFITDLSGSQGIQGPKGDPGERGPIGLRGANGTDGVDGKSAYQAWLDLGNVGTTSDFINSLKGEKGDRGEPGLQGLKGDQGDRGLQGEQGTRGEQGPQGLQGEAGQPGPIGPVGPRGERGLTGLQGPQGLPGAKGEKGDKGEGFDITKTFSSIADMQNDLTVPEGKFVMIASDTTDDPDNSKLFVRTADGYSFVSDLSGATGIVGPKGDAGSNGTDGKSAYELAVLNGFTGSQSEWLASLKGEQGEPGAQGLTGPIGPQGPQGSQGPIGPRGATGAQGATGPQGATGATGPKGDTGVGIASSEVTYAVSNSGTEAPTTGYGTTIPVVNSGQFLWSRLIFTLTDGSSHTMYSVSSTPEIGASAIRTFLVNMTHAQIPPTTTEENYRKLTWNPVSQWGNLHLDFRPTANVGNAVVIGNLPAGVPKPVSLIEAGVVGVNGGAGQVYIDEYGRIVVNNLAGNRRYTVDLSGYYTL